MSKVRVIGRFTPRQLPRAANQQIRAKLIPRRRRLVENAAPRHDGKCSRRPWLPRRYPCVVSDGAIGALHDRVIPGPIKVVDDGYILDRLYPNLWYREKKKGRVVQVRKAALRVFLIKIYASCSLSTQHAARRTCSHSSAWSATLHGGGAEESNNVQRFPVRGRGKEEQNPPLTCHGCTIGSSPHPDLQEVW